MKYLFAFIFVLSGLASFSQGDTSRLKINIVNHLLDSLWSNPQSFFNKNDTNWRLLCDNLHQVDMCKSDFCPPGYHVYADSLNRFKKNIDTTLLKQIVNGRRYINKQYYIWLVSLKLEYKILFETFRRTDLARFDSLKVITQGYDYAIPNDSRKFGIRMFENNGQWLKEPLEIMGIYDQATQEEIIKALMFDFNEMLIELGKEYHNIYHVDSRDFTSYLEKRIIKNMGLTGMMNCTRPMKSLKRLPTLLWRS